MLPAWFSNYGEIERLQRAWQTEFEKRAGGGAAALSGFHYQFLIAIHDTLRAWLDLTALERSRLSVLTECLSDILSRSSNDIILVTQVKHTRRANNVRKALNELWLIYELAVETTPSLASYLHFRILSRKTELKDFERLLIQWQPDTSQFSLTDIEVFRQKVSSELFFDPEDEVLALLANRMHASDPTGYAQRWLGMLLEAASEKGSSGFRIAARTIWNDLQSIENATFTTRPSVYVWTSKDRAPEHVVEGDVLTGERPQVHHLREGYFSPRAEVYQRIAKQADEWTVDLADKRDRQLRLPVFWIGGRSGSGKSVALIHVLALLSESGLGPIIWIGNKTELLRQAVRWALKLGAKDNQVVIGIDDPYAPNTQNDNVSWKEALAELEGVRQDGDTSALPVIICCGPTEQAERMQKDLPEEVNVQISELKNEDRKDLSRLRSWYNQRTRKTAPIVGDENVLLVQLFFEWETGQPLPEFASRFRNRIKENDPNGTLEAFITRLLCLNRLYVGYPHKAAEIHLTPELGDTLRRLREEHHVAEYANQYGIGLWLAHPHLSNVIYESWYPIGNSRAVRMDHLQRVIKDSLRFGFSPSEKMAPLWAMSAATSEALSRVDQVTILNILPSIYASGYTSNPEGSSEPMTLAQLPVWIELKATFPTAALMPHPVDEALNRINPQNLAERGLRLTCHKVLQHFNSFSNNQQLKVKESIIQLLTRAPDWQEWAPVAYDAFRKTDDSRLVKLIIDWVTDHLRSRWAEGLFALLFKRNEADPRLSSAAQDLLTRSPGTSGWGDIAIQLMEESGSHIPASVLIWLKNNYRQWGACYLLGRLLRKGLRSAKLYSFGWCERWHLERSANYVLEPLLTQEGSNEQVRDWCIHWIALNHRKADTGFLMEKLIHAFPLDIQVQSLGLQWLEDSSIRHGSWPYVWNALYRVVPEQTLSVVPQIKTRYSTDTPADNQLRQGSETLILNLKLADLQPDEPKVWYYFGVGLARKGSYEDALVALKKATELNPRFAEAWIEISTMYQRLGQTDMAIRAALRVTELRPQDPEAWYRLAAKYIQPECYQNKLAALSRGIEVDSKSTKGWRLLTFYSRVENPELALQAALKYTELKAGDAHGWFRLGIALSKNKRYKDKIASLERAVDLAPDFGAAWQMLGSAYSKQGQYKLALQATLTLSRLRPDDALTSYRLAIAYNHASLYEEELAALRRALELDAKFVLAWMALQKFYYRQGQYDLALDVLLKLVESNPGDAGAFYHLGLVYFKMRRFKEAAAAQSEAQRLRPNKRTSRRLSATLGVLDAIENAHLQPEGLDTDESKKLYILGTNLVVSNEIDEAVKAFHAAIQGSTDQAKARATLQQSVFREAIAAFHGGSYERTISHLNALIAVDTNIPDAWSLVSSAYSRIGEDKKALDAAKHLSELRPMDADAWYKVGKRHGKLDQMDEAVQAFSRALELNKKHFEARLALRGLHYITRDKLKRTFEDDENSKVR